MRAALEIRIIAVEGMPEIERGDDLAALVVAAARGQGTPIESGDVLVVTQKVVSKAEGRVVTPRDVKPSLEAQEVARVTGKDARLVHLILGESQRIVRQAGGVLITQTKHGFVCANAGVDASNVGGQEQVSLLPTDPDAAAESIRRGVEERTGQAVAVVISDTFGRPWRQGQTNVAIGLAGMVPFLDYTEQTDPHGYVLKVSTLAVADEVAAAAELAMGKLARLPVVILRGFEYPRGGGTAREMIRPPERDLFR